MPLIATNEGLMENINWTAAAICFGDMDKIQLWKANLSQIHIKDLEKCFSANGEGFEKDQSDSIWKYIALERYETGHSERSWHKAIIGWALNSFARIMSRLSCLGDDNDGEDDAGDAHAEDADEDGAESKVGEEEVEHLRGDETKEPEYAVVKASHHFLQCNAMIFLVIWTFEEISIMISLVKHMEKNIMTSMVFVIMVKHRKTKSDNLISWDEEFTEKSVAHWSEAKLEGSEKENKNSNN